MLNLVKVVDLVKFKFNKTMHSMCSFAAFLVFIEDFTFYLSRQIGYYEKKLQQLSMKAIKYLHQGNLSMDR